MLAYWARSVAVLSLCAIVAMIASAVAGSFPPAARVRAAIADSIAWARISHIR